MAYYVRKIARAKWALLEQDADKYARYLPVLRITKRIPLQMT